MSPPGPLVVCPARQPGEGSLGAEPRAPGLPHSTCTGCPGRAVLAADPTPFLGIRATSSWCSVWEPPGYFRSVLAVLEQRSLRRATAC